MILSPGQYAQSTTRDLLVAAAEGHVGIDHRWLRAILERGEQVLDDFTDFLNRDPEEFPVSMDEVLLDLARELNTPEALPFLLRYAMETDFDFSEDLIQAFLQLGEASLEPLLDLYERENGPPDVSFTLASLGVRDPRILEILISELDENPVETAISLARYGDPAAGPAIERALASAEDETTKFALEGALKELGDREPEPPEPFDVWAHYPEEDVPAFGMLPVDDLLEFLDSPVADYRALAAVDLGMEELTEVVRARLFDVAHSDPDASVRAAAWEALSGGIEDERIAPVMRARLDDPNTPPVERAGIAVALAELASEDEHIRAAILKLAGDPSVRAQALRAMWRSMDRRFSDVVARHMNDPDLLVRREAIAAAGWLGIIGQLGAIEKAMGDENLRDVALHSYALAAPGETSPARMRSLLKKVEDLAGGLSRDDALIVSSALDSRLQMHGFEPEFTGEILEDEDSDEDRDDADREEEEEGEGEGEEEELEPQAPYRAPPKVGRNEPCPCGSGKKYKKCCGG